MSEPGEYSKDKEFEALNAIADRLEELLNEVLGIAFESVESSENDYPVLCSISEKCEELSVLRRLRIRADHE